MKISRKESIEWFITASVILALFYTDLGSYAQRAFLLTGLMDAEPSEQPSIEASYDLELVDLDGKPVDMSAWKGKTIFLNFWATWCPPCRAEMPGIEDMYKEMKTNPDVIVALVSTDKDARKVVEYKLDKKLEAPMYLLRGGVPEVYAFTSIPTTFVVSAQGKVVYKHEGMARYNSKSFKKFLTAKPN